MILHIFTFQFIKKSPVGIMRHPRPFQLDLQMLDTGRGRRVWKVLSGNNFHSPLKIMVLQLIAVVVHLN